MCKQLCNVPTGVAMLFTKAGAHRQVNLFLQQVDFSSNTDTLAFDRKQPIIALTNTNVFANLTFANCLYVRLNSRTLVTNFENAQTYVHVMKLPVFSTTC